MRWQFQLHVFTAFQKLMRHETWDMSPWNKHHYFRFCKLGVGKVINRLILSWTPLTTGPCEIIYLFCFTHEFGFEEILGLVIKCFVINRKNSLEEVEKNEGWEQEIRKPQSPHRGALKLCANAPPWGQVQILVFLKKLKIASPCTQESPNSK